MQDNNFEDVDLKGKDEEHDKKKPHHHDVPPHILKVILDLQEKVGRLEGKMEVLLSIKR